MKSCRSSGSIRWCFRMFMGVGLLLVLWPLGGGSCNPPQQAPPNKDGDGDGVVDAADNCVAQANADQADFDGDGVGNICDNCPDTTNAVQADANGDGIGDACGPFGSERIVVATSDGVVEATFDDRLRLTRSVGLGVAATLIWADDASSVEATVDGSGVSNTSTLMIDLSDAALLEAAAAVETQTGEDLSDFRDFIADNPGLVAAVASGGQPADRIAKPLHIQQSDPTTRHLVNLHMAFAHLADFATAWYHEQQVFMEVPEPARTMIYQSLLQTAGVIWRDYQSQLQACTLCMPGNSCRVDCNRELVRGACCGEAGGCLDADETTCAANRFFPGLICNVDVDCDQGACCIDFDGPPDQPLFNLPPHCAPATRNICDLSTDDQHNPPWQTGTFYPGRTCAEVEPCPE